MFIDSHCHLDFPDLISQLPECISAMKNNDVQRALCISVNLEDFPRVLGLADSYPHLFASVGVHPEYTDCQEPSIEQIVALARHEKVIAIGETGLDYHWHPDKPEWQRQRFRTHIRAAKQCGKPLVIHTRQSAEDTLAILKEEGADSVGGIMHCFTEDWDVAETALALGFYLSFSGIVSFKNATLVKEVASKTPLDRLLIETDAPYLAPVPYRGKLNQPAFVRHVAEAIADIRGVSLQSIADASTENFFRLFPVTRVLET
jgi:TatD DNase family protein